MQRTFPPRSYELESLNDKTKRIIFEEGYFAEVDYPFTKKLTFFISKCCQGNFQTNTFN